MTEEKISGHGWTMLSGIGAVLCMLAVLIGMFVALFCEISPSSRRVAVVTLGDPTLENGTGATDEPPDEVERFSLYFRSEDDYAGMGQGALNTAKRTFFITAGNDGGTGVMLTHDLMVTAAHVIPEGFDGEVGVYCIREGDRQVPSIPGCVVSLSREYDVAFIRVEGCLADDAPALTLRSDLPDNQTPLHMFGYQFEGEKDMRLFAGVHRPTSIIGTVRPRDADCPEQVAALAGRAERGNSGGPVFTNDGEVIGIMVSVEVTLNRTFMVPAFVIESLMMFEGLEPRLEPR